MIDRLPPAKTGLVEQAHRTPRNEARNDFNAWLQEGSTNGAASEVVAHTEQAPALDPIISTSDASIQIEFRAADGRQETVTAPWGLAATGQLAWTSAGTWHSEAVPGIPSALHSIRLRGAAFSVSTRAEAVVSAGANATALQVRNASSAGVQANRPDALGRAADGANTARASLAGSVESWRERLMRWVQQQGRDPVVWIRDFRLEEREVLELTHRLRVQARESGFDLARIVVNGREVWCASSYSKAEETR